MLFICSWIHIKTFLGKPSVSLIPVIFEKISFQIQKNQFDSPEYIVPAMTPALSAVLVLSALTAQVSAECPDGWFHLGEACYLVSREAMTWYNGQVQWHQLVPGWSHHMTWSKPGVLLGPGRVSCRDPVSRGGGLAGPVPHQGSALLDRAQWSLCRGYGTNLNSCIDGYWISKLDRSIWRTTFVNAYYR